MKKLLYITHVDWDWIKQRPHYIAEGLSSFYDVLILYGHSPIRSNMVNNSREGLSLKVFFPIPFFISNGLIYKVHKIYLKKHFSYIIKKYDPDYIWITFPLLYNYMPCNLKAKLIYDCMDNAIGFTDDKHKQARLLKMEKKLITSSWKIFASSQNLATLLNQRKECSEKLTVIHNAIEDKIVPAKHKVQNGKKIYKIGYIGTVSSWFDFESLQYTLKHFKNIEYHIIGPFTIKPKLSENEKNKIIFYGPIQHEELYSYAQNFDCLIMPFNLNELVYSVDPVKLYEYVNYNKPIISVFYEGIKRFKSYAYFYSNKEELLSLLKDLIDNGFKNKYSEQDRLEFLECNTWNNRVKNMIKFLKLKEEAN